MKIGLFIPCYVDALFPEVGVASNCKRNFYAVDLGATNDRTILAEEMILPCYRFYNGLKQH